MTHDEIIQGLYDNTLVGNAPEVKDLTNQGLAEGLEAVSHDGHPLDSDGYAPAAPRPPGGCRAAANRPGRAR